MKKAIFSVLLSSYDPLQQAPVFAGWDTVLFTDTIPENPKGWKIIQVGPTDNPLMESRRYKILSHQYLPDYELVCYMDANMNLLKEPPSNPLWFRHPRRKNVRDEVAKVIELDKAPELLARDQLAEYYRKGFNDQVGLFQNGYFLRKHTYTINRLHEAWWEAMQGYTHRDQLSLPYAIWQTGINPENIKPANGRFFQILPHHQLSGPSGAPYHTPVHVHHITPGRGDRNLGLAINRLIEALPEEDWICLRDIDTMPTHHHVFYRQCEQIAERGDVDLVGCMTNRLGLSYQLLEGRMSENTNYELEKRKGLQSYKKHGNTVKVIDQTIAGLFMLFSKKTWAKVGKFPEGGIIFEGGNMIDFLFCQQVQQAGLKIGIAEGIYLFHDYRMGSVNTRNAKEHLV